MPVFALGDTSALLFGVWSRGRGAAVATLGRHPEGDQLAARLYAAGPGSRKNFPDYRDMRFGASGWFGIRWLTTLWDSRQRHCSSRGLRGVSAANVVAGP